MRRFILLLLCGSALGAGSPSRDEVLKAVRRLGDPKFQAREDASKRLLDWGVEEPERVLGLFPDEDSDPEIRERIERLRRRIAWEHRRSVALKASGEETPLGRALQALFNEPSEESLSKLPSWTSPSKRPVVANVLCGFLGDEDPGMRTAALQALLQIGAKTVAPAVIRLLDDPEPGIRMMAVQALGQIGDPASVQALGRLLDRTEHADVSEAALQALVQMGKAAKPAFQGLLEDGEAPLRSARWKAFPRSGRRPRFRPCSSSFVRNPLTFAAGRSAASRSPETRPWALRPSSGWRTRTRASVGLPPRSWERRAGRPRAPSWPSS